MRLLVFLIILNNIIIPVFSQNKCGTLTDYESEMYSKYIQDSKINIETIRAYDFKTNELKFDKVGRDISKKTYNKYGKLVESIKYFYNVTNSQILQYDDSSNLLEIEEQSPKGILFQKFTFVYENNELIKINHCNDKSENDKILKYLIDSISCSLVSFDLNGSIIESEQWLIDTIGLTESHIYYNKSNVRYKQEDKSYDNFKKLYKKVFTNVSFNQIIVTEYIYNDNNLITDEIIKDKNGNVKKKKSYNYSNGLLSSVLTFDKEGNAILKEEYTYELYK